MIEKVPLVTLINVSWNGRSLLEQHLPSLDAIDYPNKEVIIVDNGSVDGSEIFVRKRYPHFKLVLNAVNLGTAEGSNVAVPHAGGKYLFFVSNDMEFDPQIVNHLVVRCEGDPKIGICTVKMRRIIGQEMVNQIDSVGANIDLFGFPNSRGIYEEDHGQWDEFSEVFFSFGGAMFIRRDLFEKVGGYDPEFFTLTDDIDLSWRSRLAGYKVMVEPQAVLYHRVSATLTTSHNRAQKRFLSERNILRTLIKNYSLANLFWILPVWSALQLGEMIFFLFMRQPGSALATPRSIVWNLKRMSSTLVLRRQVQDFRKVPDSAVMAHMQKTPEKLRMLVNFVCKPNAPHWQSFFGKSIV